MAATMAAKILEAWSLSALRYPPYAATMVEITWRSRLVARWPMKKPQD